MRFLLLVCAHRLLGSQVKDVDDDDDDRADGDDTPEAVADGDDTPEAEADAVPEEPDPETGEPCSPHGCGETEDDVLEEMKQDHADLQEDDEDTQDQEAIAHSGDEPPPPTPRPHAGDNVWLETGAASLAETQMRTQPLTPDEVDDRVFDRKFSNAERHLHKELEALAPKPQSFLETGGDAAAWGAKMDELTKDVSWAQLASRVETTKEHADSLGARAPPSSFVQTGGRTLHAEMDATNAEIDAFTRQTQAELAQLQVPHTSVAAAIARAKAASSFAETSGFDDLEAKLKHLQALQDEHLAGLRH